MIERCRRRIDLWDHRSNGVNVFDQTPRCSIVTCWAAGLTDIEVDIDMGGQGFQLAAGSAAVARWAANPVEYGHWQSLPRLHTSR